MTIYGTVALIRSEPSDPDQTVGRSQIHTTVAIVSKFR
jgi:hypothetical protein